MSWLEVLLMYFDLPNLADTAFSMQITTTSLPSRVNATVLREKLLKERLINSRKS
jgi:hypothetical protein